eukprot:COSAG06_NODE_6080_length_3120_cov_14.437603_3_plen_92_part_00
MAVSVSFFICLSHRIECVHLDARCCCSINQDPLALQGRLCSHGLGPGGGIWQAWAKPIVGGATALLLLNRNATAPVNATGTNNAFLRQLLY